MTIAAKRKSLHVSEVISGQLSQQHETFHLSQHDSNVYQTRVQISLMKMDSPTEGLVLSPIFSGGQAHFLGALPTFLTLGHFVQSRHNILGAIEHVGSSCSSLPWVGCSSPT